MKMGISSLLFAGAFILLIGAVVLLILGLKSKEPQTFFTSNAKVKKKILDAIENTNKSIDIAMYRFRCLDIGDKLIEAKKRGVSIRVLVNSEVAQEERDRIEKSISEGKSREQAEQYNTLVRLKKNGIEIREDKNLHHKFAVLDSEKIITGSYNWVYYKPGEVEPYDDIVIITGSSIAKEYQDEFDTIWQKTK